MDVMHWNWLHKKNNMLQNTMYECNDFSADSMVDCLRLLQLFNAAVFPIREKTLQKKNLWDDSCFLRFLFVALQVCFFKQAENSLCLLVGLGILRLIEILDGQSRARKPWSANRELRGWQRRGLSRQVSRAAWNRHINRELEAKIAHKPWFREGLDHEVQTVN